ncbi:MAG: 2-iminoacetate synthase ThiH [Candidatus Omnitrophica bacterium]|nr:2-iminoacetate synthase ThiH [Candidatus Omnitrophota bacterium]
MSFYNTYSKYRDFDLNNFFSGITDEYLSKAIGSDNLSIEQFLSLLSPKAEELLEEAAQRAHNLTVQYFGRTIQLYTPIYISSYCENECSYCGFNMRNKIQRRKLSLEEVEKEAGLIASTGLKHILLLTGESREQSPLLYIRECIGILKRYFSSISIEIYALTEEEYGELVEEGVDGLTIYQEVYDEDIYDKVHISGPKKDYSFRMDAAERAANRKMRTINIGALLGLAPWRKEAFMLGLHAKYLQDKFTDAEISISLPRIRPQIESFDIQYPVSDKNIVQMVIAMRIFLPRLGITLSTRENSNLREDILPLGITRMSAFSTTSVGGHTINDKEEPGQFSISDKRDTASIREMLLSKGYQPVFKDWMHV